MSITKNGITLDVSGGTGNSSVTATSVVNEGLDTSATFRIGVDQDTYVDLTVNSEGRREVFSDDFVLSDGSTFNVIKQGKQ